MISITEWDRPLIIAAVSSAAIVNIFLIFLIVDANFGYVMGSTQLSPFIRGTSCLIIAVTLVYQLLHRFTYDWFVVALVGYLIGGLLIGFLEENNGILYARHAFAAIFMLASYWLGSTLSLKNHTIQKILTFFGWTTVFAGILQFIIMLPRMGVSTTSLAPAPLLLALDFGLVKTAYPVLATTFLIIVFGNKRAVLLGASAILSIFLTTKIFAQKAMSTRISCAALLTVLIVVIAVLIAQIPNRFFGGEYAERFSRFWTVPDITNRSTEPLKTGVEPQTLPPFLEKLDAFSSVRIRSTYAVWQRISTSTTTVLFGSGFGSEYSFLYWSNAYNNWNTYDVKQPDTLTNYFALTGGIVWSGVIVFLLLYKLIRIGISTLAKQPHIIGPLFVIAYSAEQFLSFVPNSPLLWLLLGALSAKPINELNVTPDTIEHSK